MSIQAERQYLTVVRIDKGIITLLEQDGRINQYRQRGIGKLGKEELEKYTSGGMLHANWSKYKELPRNYSIQFEDPYIMGRAFATFKIR